MTMPKRILILGADIVNRAYQAVLNNAGLHSICASNSDDAIKELISDSFNGKSISLIIMDHERRGDQMNGAELAKDIRENLKYAIENPPYIPIMMITSGIADEHQWNMARQYTDLFLPKPIANNHLIEYVGQFLGE